MAHILLLEDDYDLAGQLEKILAIDGHTVQLSETYQQALDYYNNADVDLVVSDIFIRTNGKLDVTGGINLIRQLKERQKATTPVIAISGGVAPNLANEQMISSVVYAIEQSGADAALVKPFHPEKLLDLISRLLAEAYRE